MATLSILFRTLLAIFGTVAVVVSGRIAYKYFKRRRRLKIEDGMKKQLAAGRKERRAMAREKNLSEVQLCVVCTENPKEVSISHNIVVIILIIIKFLIIQLFISIFLNN